MNWSNYKFEKKNKKTPKKHNTTELPRNTLGKRKEGKKEKKNLTRHYLQVVLQISQHRAECDISFQELSTTLIHVHF